MNSSLVVLIILDGWGYQGKKTGNALFSAPTPNFDSLNQKYPPVLLRAAGEAVGLPPNQMGNSEVGHLNLGAGRVVYQELPRINQAIKDGSFFENEVLLKTIRTAKKNNSSLHFLGLLSDGGVHSHINHLSALLDLASREQIPQVYLHAFLDGRDTPPQSSLEYIQTIEKKMRRQKLGEIGSVMGRYYGMDRDRRWERTALAYQALVKGDAPLAVSAKEIILQSYQKKINDEFILPALVKNKAGKPAGLIKEGDSLFFFNFRADRIRQIVKAFIEKDFQEFERGKKLNLPISCLTQYDLRFGLPVAFPPHIPRNGLGEILSLNKVKQLRIAETEKYAHVTFFFSGGVEEIFTGEERILIPSPKVATYDLKPEMSAFKITEQAIKKIDEGKHAFILINYANPDMVGHTGIFSAALRAVEVIDFCVGKIIETVKKARGTCLITADHGNIEEMIVSETGKPITSHTVNPVPFYCISHFPNKKLNSDGCLADVAPTVLKLLNLPLPAEMTGKSLI